MLFLFLGQVVVVVWQDLRRSAEGERESARQLARLVVVHGGDTPLESGHSFPLRGAATLGRGPDNSVVLPDSFVSAHHAALAYRDGCWWLSDLGSRNGTWLNDERVTGEVPVAPGDIVTVGQVKLKLRGQKSEVRGQNLTSDS